MAFGTWRSPFPRSFGGGSTKRLTRLYEGLRANIGDAITDGAASNANAETIAAARMLGTADRAIDRRVVQADPRKLCDPLLSRWERFLGITVSVNDPIWIRRVRVAARLLTFYDGGSGSIAKIAEEAFSPWQTQVHYNSVATAKTLWPGSDPPDPDSWYSTVALFAVEYIRPSGVTDDEARARRAACRASLDEHAPAWATFDFSETPAGGPYGFYLDRPNLDLCCFDE